MINISIILDSQKNARQLVTGLLEKRLVAHASIDKDNRSFMNVNGKIVDKSSYVITGQSKGLLFSQILDFIQKSGIENIQVYSVPITQCNENFGEIIRTNTSKI